MVILVLLVVSKQNNFKLKEKPLYYFCIYITLNMGEIQ